MKIVNVRISGRIRQKYGGNYIGEKTQIEG